MSEGTVQKATTFVDRTINGFLARAGEAINTRTPLAESERFDTLNVTVSAATKPVELRVIATCDNPEMLHELYNQLVALLNREGTNSGDTIMFVLTDPDPAFGTIMCNYIRMVSGLTPAFIPGSQAPTVSPPPKKQLVSA